MEATSSQASCPDTIADLLGGCEFSVSATELAKSFTTLLASVDAKIDSTRNELSERIEMLSQAAGSQVHRMDLICEKVEQVENNQQTLTQRLNSNEGMYKGLKETMCSLQQQLSAILGSKEKPGPTLVEENVATKPPCVFDFAEEEIEDEYSKLVAAVKREVEGKYKSGEKVYREEVKRTLKKKYNLKPTEKMLTSVLNSVRRKCKLPSGQGLKTGRFSKEDHSIIEGVISTTFTSDNFDEMVDEILKRGVVRRSREQLLRKVRRMVSATENDGSR